MTMDHEEAQTELDQVSMRLQQDGLPPTASVEEQQRHLWQQLLSTEGKLQSATQELQTLRTQQANEMKEVESYVAHIRGLLEEREYLTADYERDNELLRHELHQMRQQQENQSKELVEMLAQEDLGEIGLSSPSEQVAYLLVERTTLLERLEAAERRLESQSLAGSLKDIPQQAHNEEVSQKENDLLRLERDLEEASRRLTMAHQDIRRLTNELDAAKNNNLDPNGPELQGTVKEVESLREEVQRLKHSDMMKLSRTKEQNDRLDVENRALREKVHTLESEKKALLDQLAINNTDQDVITKEDRKDQSQAQNSQFASSAHEKDPIHKRCQEALDDGVVQLRELQRQLQRLRKEQEELEERNEELEALLGEAQNASKEERYRHEGELEGLHRKIKNLEAELKKHGTHEKLLKNGEEVKATESYLQLHLRDSSQERVALLEARLTEEKDWRKQLEVDLSAAQAALKKDKEALQIGERELKKLRLEVNSLQTECQQGKTLIKSLTQVRGEKAVLEEKLAQMERANSRLQGELGRCKDSSQTQEDLRENKLHVDQLQAQADRLTAELSSLQTAHNTLRDEFVSERLKTTELQGKLSLSVQEKLKAEGEKERLELEIKCLNEKLKWYQEQLSSTKDALKAASLGKKPELHTAQMESRFSPVARTKDDSLDELSCLKQDLDNLEARLAEERELASQHQLVLQVQVSEAQAHIKSQDMVLSQKAEETKQMKQDLQRVQSLFSSAERELRYEKEKNMDLKRHNTLLDQEKLKLCAELKQVQTKLVQMEQSFHSQAAECERQQQKIRELELELARNSSNRSSTTSLQEELQAERARLLAADKKVLELQQQLKTVHHQLRVEEARAGESTRLERDSRDLSDTLSALRAQQQEQHITRKLLEQREDELQQQVRSMRLKEASLTRTNAELSHRAQQLETRLNILETELSKLKEEAKNSQKSNHKLQEELAASQQECDRLQAELQQVLLQLDTHIRKYNEKQNQHKTKLRQAKQVFLKATAQRDRTIQKLESDLVLTSSLAHKEKERIHTVVEENEKLLEEKRELLRKICEAEDMGSKGMRTASTVQHRVDVLEMENRQLQDRIVKLSNQVSTLERALRNAQSFYSLEDTRKVLPSESTCDNLLQTSTLSSTSGFCGPLDVLEKIFHVNVGEHVALDSSQASVSTHQQSEQGYLNLASPLAPSNAKGTQESFNKSD